MTMTIEPQDGCQPWAFPSMCRSGVLVLERWKILGSCVNVGNLDGGSVGTEGEAQPLAWWRVQVSIEVCLLHLPPWAGARLAERGRGMPYDRPCGVAGAEGWPAKIMVVPGVLEWLLWLKECLDGWGCLQFMSDEVVVGHYHVNYDDMF